MARKRSPAVEPAPAEPAPAGVGSAGSPGPTAGDYDRYREKQAAISRERSAKGREIGPLPEVEDPKRKGQCRGSLRLFCEVYLKGRFPLKWSRDHLKAIEKLERAILFGGLFALAMPRGSGKTSLCEAAAIWAILFGHRRFVALIGATGPAASEMLESIKVELETNDLLVADFPEVCFPVVMLDGINQRANAQTLNGQRTRVTWTDSQIVFATVPGSAASGSRIRVAGLEGRVRGMKATTAAGESIRPDFAIADDPQTDESAHHPPQTAKRERILLGAVKGLAGPGKTIAMVIPCTVIAKDDLADRILDRNRSPQFQGERFKMVYSFPRNVALWDQYAEIRRESLKVGNRGAEATKFYRANRKAMDDGAEVAWPERYDRETEASAVQSAMNMKIDNPSAFLSECQNEPEDETKTAGVRELDPAELGARLTRVPRGEVPCECTRLTAFIDLSSYVLWYTVAAFDEGFAGSVVDYGTWPPQNRSYFEQSDARPALADVYPTLSEEQRVYAGLRDLTARVLGRTYQRHQTDETLSVERCLIDEGWLDKVVYQFCRESAHRAVLMPSKGLAAKSSTARPMSQWPKRLGERASPANQPAWRVGPVGTGKGRHCTFDADEWKTFMAARLLTPPGGAGCLRLFGERADAHRLVADHCAAEWSAPVTAHGRTWDKWHLRPGRDNHLWDCVVGCAVAAGVLGVQWTAAEGQPGSPPARRVVNFGKTFREKHPDG